MGSLGDFGAAAKEATGEADDFTFFGERFEIPFIAPPILYLQVGAAATGKLDETEGLAAVWQLFDICLGPDEFARFYKVAVAKRADLDSLIALSMAIFQAQAGRPTEEPVGSLPGLSTTLPSSSSGSSPSPVSGPVLSAAPSLQEVRQDAHEIAEAARALVAKSTGDTRDDAEILSTPERIARMRPVADLLTG